MTLKKTSQLIGVFLLTLSLQGCRWFHGADIQQGNILTDTQIGQLKQGMTIHEVKKLLGTPVLIQNKGNILDAKKQHLLPEDTDSDTGDDDSDLLKLEYAYFYQPSYGKFKRQRITLTFEDEKLNTFKILA